MNLDDDILKKFYRQRSEKAKKYDHGSVLVIGGSRIYSGSPALAAFSALRGGADIVQVAAPRRAADIVAGFSPDLITYPLDGKCLSDEHLSRLLEITEAMKVVSNGRLAVVIGGGAGRREETKKLIRNYLKEISLPTVVDADGIYAFENEGEDIIDESLVFTPHLYEFFVLTGKKLDNLSLEKRKEAVKREAATIDGTILLKGPTDIISDGSRVLLNDFPVPELTAGGCGDTLAGLVGALLARDEGLEAVAGAAYLNTRAGQLAAEEMGDSLIAEDLIEKIPRAIDESIDK